MRHGARSGSLTHSSRTRRRAWRRISAISGSRDRSSQHSQACSPADHRVEIYGKMSGVGERTYGSAPALVGEDVSSFHVRGSPPSAGDRAQAVVPGEHAFDVSVGRTPYDSAMVSCCGTVLPRAAAAADTGRTRARHSSSPRSARARGPSQGRCVLSGQGRSPGAATPGRRLWGTNYELTIDDAHDARRDLPRIVRRSDDRAPARDGLHVLNLRADLSPLAAGPRSLLRVRIRRRATWRSASTPTDGPFSQPMSSAAWAWTPTLTVPVCIFLRATTRRLRQ